MPRVAFRSSCIIIELCFRARKIIRDKEGHYITLEESVLQEDLTILNVYVPNNRSSNYMREKLIALQGETDKSTIQIHTWRLQHPLSKMDRSSRQKIHKDINNTFNQLDIIDITLFTSSRLHIHLKFTWSIHQNRSITFWAPEHTLSLIHI